MDGGRRMVVGWRACATKRGHAPPHSGVPQLRLRGCSAGSVSTNGTYLSMEIGLAPANSHPRIHEKISTFYWRANQPQLLILSLTVPWFATRCGVVPGIVASEAPGFKCNKCSTRYSPRLRDALPALYNRMAVEPLVRLTDCLDTNDLKCTQVLVQVFLYEISIMASH